MINPLRDDSTDENGLGGTLTANALSLAAMKVTLEQIITKEVLCEGGEGEREEEGGERKSKEEREEGKGNGGARIPKKRNEGKG